VCNTTQPGRCATWLWAPSLPTRSPPCPLLSPSPKPSRSPLVPMLSTFSTAFSILHCTVTHIPISIAKSLLEVGFHCVPDCSWSLSMICPCCANSLCPLVLQIVLTNKPDCNNGLQQHIARRLLGPSSVCASHVPTVLQLFLYAIKALVWYCKTSTSGQIGVTLCRWVGHGCSLLVRQPWQCWWRAMVRCAPWCCAMGGWPVWPPCCTLLVPRARKQLQKPSRHALHSFVAGWLSV
jgi:hypothetical protein